MEGNNARSFPLNPPSPEWWVPNTDIYVTEDGFFLIEVELAGMIKEDVVTTEEKRIIIRGERSLVGRRQRCQYLVQEFRYGHSRMSSKFRQSMMSPRRESLTRMVFCESMCRANRDRIDLAGLAFQPAVSRAELLRRCTRRGRRIAPSLPCSGSPMLA